MLQAAIGGGAAGVDDDEFIRAARGDDRYKDCTAPTDALPQLPHLRVEWYDL